MHLVGIESRDHFELLIESVTNLRTWYKDKDHFGGLLEFNCLEVLISRSLSCFVYRKSLPTPVSFHLVRPLTTSYSVFPPFVASTYQEELDSLVEDLESQDLHNS